jgi:PTH1 family peptidyl-tRNA hydrolase
VIAVLARRHGATLKRSKDQAEVAEVTVGGKRLALAVPQTYMNDSGRAVAPLVRRYGIEDLTDLVVVHDELDLPLGTVRVKSGGGLAGHNGLRSIKAHLHSADFSRIRIGIGKPPGGKDRGADHVLRAPGKKTRQELDVVAELAADAIECILSAGLSAAQNRFNGKPDTSPPD